MISCMKIFNRHGSPFPGRRTGGAVMKKRTVRRTLLNTYSLIILASFLALALTVAAVQIPRTREQTFSVLRQRAASAAAEVDAQCGEMRTIALNIAYSTQLQDRLILINSSGNGEAAKLSTLLSLIIFPNRPVDQINLYTSGGEAVHSGLLNSTARERAEDQPWYPLLQESEEPILLFFSGPDEQLGKFITDVNGKQFISLVMQNRDNFNNPCGYTEIKQRLSRVISSIVSYTTVYGEEICFFSRDGTLIYPAESAYGEEVFNAACAEEAAGNFVPVQLENGRVFACAIPAGRNFRAVMIIRNSDLVRPVQQLILNIVFFTLLALVLAFLLSRLASRRITRPIDSLCQQIAAIDLSKPARLPPPETDIAELAELHNAFDRMQGSLSDHVNRLLLLQNQEMQSRMLALQAQMNPHFLFNSLAAIQAMSDEGMNDEISVMCRCISGILRYISSDSSQEVPLRDELHYTEDYLTCMALRYRGDLRYEIDVPEELSGALVPKLCVQLLAENAIKFTTTVRPPWLIRIEGRQEEDRYELRIIDNGPGFGEETLKELEARMEEIRRTSTLPSLKIHGMGILNVFIRYCLLYENRFAFRLENNPEGGACVVIGACIHESDL